MAVGHDNEIKTMFSINRHGFAVHIISMGCASAYTPLSDGITIAGAAAAGGGAAAGGVYLL